MFTGSAPYTEICRDALHPGFAGNMLVNTAAGLMPAQGTGDWRQGTEQEPVPSLSPVHCHLLPVHCHLSPVPEARPSSRISIR